MPHNGVDIDQYLLLILYPSIAFFATGYLARRKNISKSNTYAMQSIICFAFSILYYFAIPHGGAQGLVIILGLFGILLLVLARKEKINPTKTEEIDIEQEKTAAAANTTEGLQDQERNKEAGQQK
jgi:peptidoglycan/LPS O-acetylase OafA/YrhL